jgi:hypothetical protein
VRGLQRFESMAQTIHVFQTPMSQGGRSWVVEARGEEREDGRWEGWLVFTPADGGTPMATGRETTQSSREALGYWAGGLAPIYLEGAFSRALRAAA